MKAKDLIVKAKATAFVLEDPRGQGLVLKDTSKYVQCAHFWHISLFLPLYTSATWLHQIHYTGGATWERQVPKFASIENSALVAYAE